jgi:hypothetical protein
MLNLDEAAAGVQSTDEVCETETVQKTGSDGMDMLPQIPDTNDLAWSHFKPTPTGLKITGQPTYEQWEAVGYHLRYIDGAVKWWIGDWLNYGENRWGEKYSQALESTEYEYQTLADAAWVAKQVDISLRNEKLSWSHHRMVAPLEPQDQQKILDTAVTEKLTVRETQELVRTHNRNKQLASIPQPETRPVIYQKSALDFLTALDNGSVDLLITDPPYITDVEDIAAFVDEWLPLALAKLKDSGQAYIFTGAYPKELQAYLNCLLDNERFTVENVLVWSYKNTLGASPKRSYIQNWQAAFYIRGKDAPDIDCPIALEQFAVQEINAPDGRLGDRFYKWQKPDLIAEMYIRHGSKYGDVVVDPFAGSGTFILAAHRLGRDATGCDIDEAALKIAEARGCERG